MCMYFVYFFQNIFEIFLAKMPYLGTYIDFYQLQNIVVDAICASSLLRGNHYILLYGYNAIEREKAFVFMRYWAHQKRLLWCNSRKSVACQWFFVFVIVIIRWQDCQFIAILVLISLISYPWIFKSVLSQPSIALFHDTFDGLYHSDLLWTFDIEKCHQSLWREWGDLAHIRTVVRLAHIGDIQPPIVRISER